MSDRFTAALLAALNESAEVKESDWDSIAAVLRDPIAAVDAPTQEAVYPPAQEAVDFTASENRFAAIVSSCMAKIREGR